MRTYNILHCKHDHIAYLLKLMCQCEKLGLVSIFSNELRQHALVQWFKSRMFGKSEIAGLNPTLASAFLYRFNISERVRFREVAYSVSDGQGLNFESFA